MLKVCGGETGIRTLDTLRYTRFPSVRLQPLGHLSAVLRAFLNLTQFEGYRRNRTFDDWSWSLGNYVLLYRRGRL